MAYINRACVIVRVGNPYIEWASNLDDSDLVPNPEADEPSVYLIPNYDFEDEAWSLLERCYHVIFEEELEAWHMIESDWPEDRSFEKFKQWFAVEFCSGVQDFADEPIIYEDDA